MNPPPDPPPDLPIDPIDELANELLDAGRLATEPGLDPVVAARLGELVEVRAGLRDVPLPAADQRDRAIAAALAAFDEQPVSSDASRSPSPSSAATAPPPTPVRSLDRARAGRDRSAPSRWAGPILGVAAAVVVALGIAALARSSTHSEKTSSAGSLASTRAAAGASTTAAGAATTAAASAASPGLAEDSAKATGADGGVGASQPAFSTAAAASATTAAAATTSAAKSVAPGGERTGSTTTTGGGLVDLGAIDDPTALIDRLVSLNVQLTSTPSAGTGTTAANPTSAFGPCGTAEAPAVALVRWKGVPAVVVPAIGGPSVRSLIDCSELVHL